MKIALSPAQRADAALLAGLLTPDESAALDLPLVIGKPGFWQRRALAPEAALGMFGCGGVQLFPEPADNSRYGDHADDFRRMADRLTRPAPYLAEKCTASQITKTAALSPLVAALLRADFELTGTRNFCAQFDWAQDRPGPHYIRSPNWHYDARVREPGEPRLAERLYLIRTSSPPEIIKARRELCAPVRIMRPEPYDVVMLLADQHRHRSTRPRPAAMPAFLPLRASGWSSFFRLRLQPVNQFFRTTP